MFEENTSRSSSIAIFEEVNQDKKLHSSQSANWLRKHGVERATGIGAVLKRKLWQPDTDQEEENVSYSTHKPTKRLKCIKYSSEILDLNCKWDSCNFHEKRYHIFTKHVLDHICEFSSSEKEYLCQWNDCNYKIGDYKSFQRHVSYHPYLCKLKCIGTNMNKRCSLPECIQDVVSEAPQYKTSFICDWESCGNSFDVVQYFIDHVKSHTNCNPRKVNKNSKETIRCFWKDCKYTCVTLYLLDAHVRTHTFEKMAACPDCNRTFCNKTKYNDHRKRQENPESQGFQCSQCLKVFASERLLRNHVRVHINHYKCSLCDMTCTTPASLSRHIRYRHTTDRPFECLYCDHRTVTKNDLTSHLVTHSADLLYTCDTCDFKCRSQVGLDSHYTKEHAEAQRIYACHCCSKNFFRGSFLTRHLITLHNFRWPSGHSRFRYKQDPSDGYYRLQTIRYESIEVTQEMMSCEKLPETSLPKQSYTVKQECSSEKTPMFVVLPENEQLTEEVEEKHLIHTNKDVLITIEEVDEKGNILRSEILESNELIYTSNEKNMLDSD